MSEDQIADLLIAWEDHYQQGRDVPAEELCQGCPELAREVAQRIESLKRTAWLMGLQGEATTPPSAATGDQGQVLAGRYRLDKRLGVGGFGEVWQGFDLELQRPVAVKMPRNPRLSEDVEGFLVEARKVARLKHPGIVPVHDVARHEGAYFIVSDFIDGCDLAERLRQKPFTVRGAVQIVAEAARHLHHAHQQGFIHRDIKPANLLVDADDKVFITDFGIAVTEAELRQRENESSGTLAYMSPEQLQGDPGRIDARTDLYSLGVVLYQLLTGRLPFEADRPEGMRERILRQEPVPPRTLRKDTPREVERICLKCLAKSPAKRYPSAQALADDVARWASRRRANGWLAGGMLAAMALLLVWLFVRGRSPSPAEPAPGENLIGIPADRLGPEEVLFNGKDLTGWVAYQPDGEEAFHAGEGGTLRLRGGPKGHLRTERAFADFVLRLEYLLPEGGRVTGNGSGVLLRMAGPDRRGAHYLEANIGTGNTGDIWWAAGRRCTRYRLLNERPIGEWNEYVIVCCGDKLKLILNGKVVNEVVGLEEGGGHVGIIAQGTDVWFRHIRLSPVTKGQARSYRPAGAAGCQYVVVSRGSNEKDTTQGAASFAIFAGSLP